MIIDVVVVFVVQHHSSIAVANHISVVFQCIVHSVYNRVCYFTSDGIYNTSKFLLDINKSFGSGGMSAWFRDKELPELIHFLKKGVQVPVKQAATVVGRQPNSDVWVMSPHLQVSTVTNQLTLITFI